MGEPQMDGDQSPVISDTDMMDCLNLDGYGDVEDPHMEGAKGERQPSAKVDELQSTMDVDLTGITSVEDEGNEKQNAMDVDLKEILREEDEGKGKTSSDLPSHVPVDFDVASPEKFCKEASRSFFSETGLVSHQINSYNHFVSHGLQELFDSFGEITVEPDYDPSNKDGAWKHATVKFGRVKLGEPVFMVDNSDLEQQDLKFKPRHARLQKMTYASRMNVEMTVQVYILDKSDKAKTGKDTHVHRRDIMTETKQVSMGLLPVMVKSNLCWLHKLQESDCQFDFGGYFLIKGTEKHDRVAWGPMPFVDARWTTLVNKQKFDKDTCCFQHMRCGRSFELGIRKPIGIRKLKKSFSQALKSFRNIDHGKFPRYWTYKRLIPANPPLQRDGSCTIVSLCIALELRYFIEQKKKQIQDKIEVDMTWTKRICKQAGVYSASEGSHPYDVLDTIMKMGGIITRKCNMQDGEFSRRIIPVKDYGCRAMERMSPSDAIYELYVYGPFVGSLFITEDYEYGSEKIYKGCPMPLDGVSHSVVCYGYQWIREKLHLEVLDNIDSKAGPYRLVPFEVFDDFVFPYV